MGINAFILKFWRLALAVMASLFVGVLFFLYSQNLLIVYFAFGKSKEEKILSREKKDIAIRKKITLSYWKDDIEKTEEHTMLLLQNKSDTLKHVIGSWLSLVHEERILERRVQVERVALSELEDIAYISFDQLLCSGSWPINKKWQLFAGLCKTVAGTELGVNSLQFLMQDNIMDDDHLDFTLPWSVVCI